MKKPRISIIVAIGENREIGKDNKIPWDMPDDRRRFRDITLGHPVIIGRKTFESILSYIKKPLPGRTNIVVTRDQDYKMEGVVVAHSLDEALGAAAATGTDEVFVGGGAELFRQALPITDRLYLTIVHGKFEADTYFPDYREFAKVLHEEKGESNHYIYTYKVLEK